MTDYISRDSAIEAVHNHFDEGGFNCYDDGQMMLDKIMDLPAAPVREVVRGRWISERCSACGEWAPSDGYGWIRETKYCPNCGADMREDA